jgi:hypothetical protein
MRETTLTEFFNLYKENSLLVDKVNILDLPLPFHMAEDPVVK